ncbi:MAG: 30S ribosome-binding factor RbfA [Chloroflexota bacterium]|nr:30S ribosome-binding factor RbfA [Chloroflexota bacterium]
MTSRRQLRVAEQLQRELAQIIDYDLRDPRLEFVSVTRVDVTGDLRYATVYVSKLGDETSGKQAVKTLEKAAGYIRREIGSRLSLQYVPELNFRYDDGMIISQRLGDLLDSLVPENSDEAHEAEMGPEETGTD